MVLGPQTPVAAPVHGICSLVLPPQTGLVGRSIGIQQQGRRIAHLGVVSWRTDNVWLPFGTAENGAIGDFQEFETAIEVKL